MTEPVTVPSGSAALSVGPPSATTIAGAEMDKSERDSRGSSDDGDDDIKAASMLPWPGLRNG
jgi:hypothetical protein